ncbi:type 1 fimbria pilin [Erwinia toletana]|uniref:Type 1 fimbria pilin n=1 Tax=Winslowiella toletana TaxID=92490 RepID=A0ABS4P4I0_9GAMM|nr:hypothetical protein [Winslowiella toletana]MBP2167558.1 type 1 fimbria pilin [Winslowiella toletana]
MLFASWTSSVIAGSGTASASSGTIRFSGAIVDGGCVISPGVNNQLKTICHQNGRIAISITELNLTQQQKLPLSQGTSQFAWIDRSKALGMLTVNYY